MPSMLRCGIIVALCSAVHCSPFEDCGSPSAKVTSLDISGCPDGSSACEFETGPYVYTYVVFAKKLEKIPRYTIGGNLLAKSGYKVRTDEISSLHTSR
jgi:hypothetical protein